MLLFYIRHGEPIYDPDSLTPFGEKQAEAIGKRLALYGVDRIFASTSNRAIQTAMPTSKALGKEITLLYFCNEAHAWKNFTVVREDGTRTWAFYHQKTKELFADKTMSLNDKWYEDKRLPENTFKAGVERVNANVDEWLLGLGYQHDREKGIYKVIKPTEERVALFAHQGFGSVFLSSVLDIPYPLFATHFDIGHSDMTVIDFADDNGVVIPKVLTHSNDGHLYRESLSTKYNGKWEF